MKRNSLPKATLAQVKKDIAPFVKKRFLGGSYIEGEMSRPFQIFFGIGTRM